MRFIAYALQFSKAHLWWVVKGQHTREGLAVQLNDVLGRLEHPNGNLLVITPCNTSSNYSITCELQWTLEASRMEWPALTNHIPCMAQIIQLAEDVFTSTLGVKGRTKSWEAHECDKAIWREWKHQHWEESKTSTRGQCSNQQGVSDETRFSKDNWESTYFRIFWKSWNYPSYSRKWFLYWLCWHLVIETSSLTFKSQSPHQGTT